MKQSVDFLFPSLTQFPSCEYFFKKCGHLRATLAFLFSVLHMTAFVQGDQKWNVTVLVSI